MGTVLACGLTVLDVIQTVDHVPAPDEKLVASDLLVAAGGPAANAAVTAAALGATARLVTRAGRSVVGRLVAEDLAAHGVDVVDLAGPEESPAVSTVLVSRGTGHRAVVSVNATRAAPAPPDDVTARDLVVGADVVLVDGHHLDLAVPVARAARAAGVPVLLDGGSWKPGLQALLAHVDVAVLSADLVVPAELAGHLSDQLAAVASLGPRVVGRSHGPGPVELRTPAGRTEIPVPAVTVLDTLGAGDVLHGALAVWFAEHGVADPAAGLAWAARAAAASCEAPGARGWLSGPEPGRLRAGLL
ncbi:PfkB family carbohydrate kinase [Isoptericola sp. b441]|uniref:PfkB family carbohydrate kinase n=1 Tax=Actinotalea lenta TaxID=3064654 RepID=A0ABT9D6T2_9CELL|nr:MULTISPECIES: PfkB family carbohydrate kinase [unclassified Isoptericola]MDO8106549.1 PfkB family carbohydrate kinase [Isoptericola sp. b441]MDO8121743.1 PfkB family carbohydrate kinase [Isoptericola sp. b490]